MCIVFLSQRAYFVLFVELIIVVKVITLLKGAVNFVTGYFRERIRMFNAISIIILLQRVYYVRLRVCYCTFDKLRSAEVATFGNRLFV